MVDANFAIDDLQRIASLHEQVDKQFTAQLSEEEADNAKIDADDAIQHKRIINDQACFVLAWGQLEAGIESACRTVIRHGQSQSDWNNRRVWSSYNPDDRRLSGLSFENRLTLVLEKGSRNWKQTLEFYQTRIEIAHGKLQSKRIEVSDIIPDFFEILSSLASE